MRTVVLNDDFPRIVPVLANYGISPEVNPGTPTEMPDDVAGRPPQWDENGTMTDPGAGLLAQYDSWTEGN